MIVINFKDTGIMQAVVMGPSLCSANEIAKALITHQSETSPFCLCCHSETDQRHRQICSKSAVFSAPACPSPNTNLTQWQLIVHLLCTSSSRLRNLFFVYCCQHRMIDSLCCSVDAKLSLCSSNFNLLYC